MAEVVVEAAVILVVNTTAPDKLNSIIISGMDQARAQQAIIFCQLVQMVNLSPLLKALLCLSVFTDSRLNILPSVVLRSSTGASLPRSHASPRRSRRTPCPTRRGGCPGGPCCAG